jgi:hypothetical protein
MLEKVLDESFVRSFRAAMLVAAGLALTSALCAGLMIRPLRRNSPVLRSFTNMYAQAVHDHCNAKVPTQNLLFFLVDPSQREQFCAPHH